MCRAVEAGRRGVWGGFTPGRITETRQTLLGDLPGSTSVGTRPTEGPGDNLTGASWGGAIRQVHLTAAGSGRPVPPGQKEAVVSGWPHPRAGGRLAGRPLAQQGAAPGEAAVRAHGDTRG